MTGTRYPWRLLHDQYPLEVAYGVGWGTSWKVTRSDVEAVWWILTDISDLFKLRGHALCTAVIVIIVITGNRFYNVIFIIIILIIIIMLLATTTISTTTIIIIITTISLSSPEAGTATSSPSDTYQTV